MFNLCCSEDNLDDDSQLATIEDLKSLVKAIDKEMNRVLYEYDKEIDALKREINLLKQRK